MAQHKFNFRLITRDDSTAVACDAWLEGWNLEGRRMSEARDFRRSAAQVARQAGEEPDANEAQRLLSIGILGNACRDGRLAARPARSGHLALGPVQIHRPASLTLFFA